jgi:hypothetical protein
MVWRRGNQTTTYKTLDRKLKIEQHEPHKVLRDMTDRWRSSPVHLAHK